ncbi:MAG: hypothetical protein K8F62_05890 [Pseudorhodoplanes sp.]|nr:hypothetical protein [Pseudorhodoplanes sp.]
MNRIALDEHNVIMAAHYVSEIDDVMGSTGHCRGLPRNSIILKALHSDIPFGLTGSGHEPRDICPVKAMVPQDVGSYFAHCPPDPHDNPDTK